MTGNVKGVITLLSIVQLSSVLVLQPFLFSLITFSNPFADTTGETISKKALINSVYTAATHQTDDRFSNQLVNTPKLLESRNARYLSQKLVVTKLSKKDSDCRIYINLVYPNVAVGWMCKFDCQHVSHKRFNQWFVSVVFSCSAATTWSENVLI